MWKSISLSHALVSKQGHSLWTPDRSLWPRITASGKSRQMLLSSSSIVIFWARVRVSAVLHVGDDVLLIARAAQRAAMHQLRAKLIVGAANGKALFGHIALEGARVLAVGGLKLVQAGWSPAGWSCRCLPCPRVPASPFSQSIYEILDAEIARRAMYLNCKFLKLSS